MTSTSVAPPDAAPPSPFPAVVARSTRTTLTEAERIQALREIIGEPDPTLSALPKAIRALTFRNHDRWVKPLYEEHWPEALLGSTAKKLRFLTCNLYATSPYTVLLASTRPPLVLRAVRTLGTALGLEPQGLASWAGVGVKLAAHFLDDDTHRRIIQIATFIAAVDHIYDHYTGDLPVSDRGKKMRGVLDGSWGAHSKASPNDKPFLFLRALFVEMSKGIEGEDKLVFDIAINQLFDYVDAEVKALTGVPDPTGCCWRMAGVLGTIDGLFFPVWRYTLRDGEKDVRTSRAREWMYSVSLFVQVMDDWIDLEKDAADIRPTPVITGFWTLETVKETWEKTTDGIVDLARESGVADESWLTFVKETYKMMAVEVMEAMCKGSAA